MEHDTGYERTLFKHWVDADHDGCNTRKEVLQQEALTQPTKTGTCTLTGGKWLSPYDNVIYYDQAKLDIDHLVPLSEAWKSGAWRWTPQQRENYANDLQDPRALIAVTGSLNRQKSDSDIAHWLPPINTCTYVTNYIAIKIRYQLSFDPLEAKTAENFINTCPIKQLTVDILPGYTNPDDTTTTKVTLEQGLKPKTTPQTSAAPNPFQPLGATARCKDGTYSYSTTHTGTCSRHGGVQNWIKPLPK